MNDVNSLQPDNTLSANQLKEIIKNPSSSFIKEINGEITLYFSGYIFEDDYIILDNSIIVDLPLLFLNCEFKTSTTVFISGLVCNKSLTFDSCIIKNGIIFNSGVFRKEVLLKYVEIKSIYFNGGSYEDISISGYNIDDVFVSNSKFKSLNLGELLRGYNIKNVSIIIEEENVGDIYAYDQCFDKLSLSGVNKSGKISFVELRCDNISFTDFKNEGSLNFYGFEPKDVNSKIKYFQIVNSNLGKAEFYRGLFSYYKEVIIIDSFITDALFIGCEWISNIRALYGPGYDGFDTSLMNNRKITPKEIVAIKEAYRQLKVSMSKHSDKIQELKFYSDELTFHNRTLSWGNPLNNNFWDKLILSFSKLFSDYGQSFVKPVIWLLFGHFILFLVAILFGGFSTLNISFKNPTREGFLEAFESYFIYINPFRKLEISLSGYLIILDLIMRIWSSYMIYNIIRASRRFIL